ncbi:MAG: histidine--tRNA ligase [Candidatus Margulisbacteria bacterium]|nr:histidine--tRNA ligase [Candidatus Margulisiibacteriota bacterium]
MKYTCPRGTRDILPEESYAWRYISNQIIDILTLYNYQEIQTPIFESADLFQRAVGDTTDIVEKEMYIFKDKGDRSLALRPEGTASIVRAYLENSNYFQKRRIVKLFYTGPMFRYERPQTGRYRQFNQIGVECIGSASPFIDAETMIMGVHLFQKLGIEGLKIAIHSVGCDVCRPVIRERLKGFVESILPNLCSDCKSRFDRNPLRILDCKNPDCQTYFAGMPEMGDALCKECNDHFLSVINLLEENQIKHEVDSHLVRGLDYYTKTVFEIRSPLLGAQNAICGGGRYDNLITELGGRKTPAFGFAIGLDRLYMVFSQLNLLIPGWQDLPFFIIGLGSKSMDKALSLTQELRGKQIKAEMYFKNGPINDGLKEALNLKTKFAIIIGEEELEKQFYTVKNLKDKVQFTVKTIADIIKLLD